MSQWFYTPFSVEDFNELFDEAFDNRHQSSAGGRAVSRPNRQRELSTRFNPRLDLHENAEKNIVTATFELPGLKKSDVNIDVHDNRLTVSGENTVSSEHTQDGYAVRERRFGKFSRSILLPRGVQPNQINAKMEDGVLTVTFPRAGPEQEPSKINIA
ncbi:small heat shock protein [Sistotremastrum niveocremeum HHB9708]|uniref:Small heat shock protein n=2 Tax=Sistotremastraceae TaxID=3402574 RepID=A0A164WA16_9AGAM|nr:small heat shock protein [Sistotremastrum niveocremeum HHB9708]KZT36877.1 small heat shock protein [Sistotremastrum suecicum HHB10207 ss-3]